MSLSEQIRRQSAQAQLIANETEARKVVQDLETENLELQKKLDFLEIEHAKLKMEVFHSNVLV